MEPTALDKPADLSEYSDEQLKETISTAKKILKDRDNSRKKETLAKIKKMAQEAGLDIEVKKAAPKKKRTK